MRRYLAVARPLAALLLAALLGLAMLPAALAAAMAAGLLLGGFGGAVIGWLWHAFEVERRAVARARAEREADEQQI